MVKDRIKRSLPEPVRKSLSGLKSGLMERANELQGWSLRLAGRLGESLKYSLIRPGTYYSFVVVSPERNAGAAGRKCLQSVYEQNYDKKKVRHIFIDDASSDNTPEIVKSWMKEHPDNRVEFIETRRRSGILANKIKGFDMALPGALVIELDGDDWLPDKNVLKFLNKVYQDDKVWMTYNTFLRLSPPGYTEISKMKPVPAEVIEDNDFRKYKWQTSHLHSFRAELYRHVDKGSFIDPDTGEYWECSTDPALYLPMLELAGRRSRHIYRITCIYNFHENTIAKTDAQLQRETAERIRQQTPYKPLQKLSSFSPQDGGEEK